MHITDTDISNRLEASIRPFFKIASIPLPASSHSDLVDSLVKAINIYAQKCHLRRPVQIIMAVNPTQAPTSSGTLTFECAPGSLSVTIENLIFVDVNAIHPLPLPLQIACFLEEMVHGIMGVSDELTTSHIVAALYDGVKIVNDQYVAQENG